MKRNGILKKAIYMFCGGHAFCFLLSGDFFDLE